MNPDPRWQSEFENLSAEPFFSVRQLKVTDTLSGHLYTRHAVDHPGGAGVVAVSRGQALCVKQYRPAIEAVTIEIPAGRREAGESAIENASRELFEETGYIAAKMEHLCRFHAVPCFSTWVADIYLATDVCKSMLMKPEEDIPSTLTSISLDEVENLVNSGIITDGKTIIGLLLARAALHKRTQKQDGKS